MYDLFWIILTISSLLYGIFQFPVFLYVSYIFYAIYIGLKKNTWKNINNEAYYFISLLMFSIIMPDNYLTIIVSILESGYIFFKYRYKLKLNRFSIIALIYLILNILLSPFKPLNLIFSCLYYIPIVTIYYICKFYFLRKINIFDNILKLLKRLLITQYMTVLSYAVTHISIITSMIDFDWVVGTFGQYQGNILLFFCITSSIMFLYQFHKTKNTKELIYFVFSILLAIMTGSIAMLIMFAATFIIVWVILKKDKIYKKIIYGLVLFIFIFIFSLVTPDWILRDLNRLTDFDYMKTRISKLETYENTFKELHDDNLLLLIKGTGIGQYSSRAALTCTGEYIGAYNKIFSPSISKYTDKYIYPKYLYVKENRLGSLDTPYSSIITIHGELGIIGLCLLLLFFGSLLYKKNIYSKLLITFFFTTLFIENYLEFAKVICCIYLAYYFVNQKKFSNDKTK